MTTSLLDHAVFDELSDAMGTDFVAELVTTFLEDAPNMLNDMKKATAVGDADAYRRAAHSIKSNAEVFGACALAQQARELELAGAIDAARLSGLELTYDATASELRKLIEG